MSPKHFLNTQDWSRDALDALPDSEWLLRGRQLIDYVVGRSS